MHVTMITAGMLGLLLVLLSLRVSLIRRGAGISVGDAGNAELLVRMRSQANLVEYAPTALILLFLAEQSAIDIWLVAGLATLLLAARIAHPFGMAMPAPNAARIFGTVGTWAAIAVLAVLVLVAAPSMG